MKENEPNKTYLGLSSTDVKSLLAKHGENTIEDQHKESFFKKVIEQFSSFLIILLILAAFVSLYIGEVVDAVLILTIVLLNALFGIYQEYKAEQAVASLKNMTISTVRVIRDGKEHEIDSKYIVPGDIILIEEGNKIPGDAQIEKSINLEVNEAALTGESIPVVKGVGDEIFMGTIVSKGRGTAIIKATGMKTKFGQIAEKLSSVEELQTPLQRKLSHITEIIGVVGIIVSLFVFLLSILQGNAYFPSFLLAISLAVAVVPESLPAVMTITLSIGVKHMAKKKAIMRKLSAIEGLGSVTLIATDKTGTLTKNIMRVKNVWVDDKQHPVHQHHQVHIQSKTFELLLLNGIVCSTASLVDVHDHGKLSDVIGDPTEGALLYLAKDAKHEPESVRKSWETMNEKPFDSKTKRMSVAVKNDHQELVFSKGAPESIIEITSHLLINGQKERITAEKKEHILNIMRGWASEGLRVLAFSYKENHANFEKDTADEIFLGMVAIYDPPREEAKKAVQRAHAAGINVVMITGDNGRTAEAIASHIGLINHGDIIIKGEQLEKYTDEELLKILPSTKVFARTTPFHKSRIVSLYQKLGEVVAVTGDGVNDAIALKQADVGIAMGRVGTDVARETADMVITDDNFATIVNAVEEGRNIVNRLKNSIKYLLAGNLSEALSLVAGLLLGLPPLFLPIQLLFINLISDGLPALAMAFSPSQRQVMNQKPEKKLELLKTSDYKYISSVAILATLMVLCTYYFFSPSSAIAKQTAVFTVIGLIQAFVFVDIWLSRRKLDTEKSRHRVLSPLFFVTFFIPVVAHLILVKFPIMADIFHINTLSWWQFGGYILISSFVLIGIRGMKAGARYL